MIFTNVSLHVDTKIDTEKLSAYKYYRNLGNSTLTSHGNTVNSKLSERLPFEVIIGYGESNYVM